MSVETEHSIGDGIGPLLTPEEGQARLEVYAEWCATSTPAPWQRKDEYEGYNVIIGNVDGESFSDGTHTFTYDFIANCEDEYGEQTPPANVQLILAAPEMYVALAKITSGATDEEAQEIALAALIKAGLAERSA